jgi:hypothetical protein
MRLLFGRLVFTEGRQSETLTAPAVHLPTYRFLGQTIWTETTRVLLGFRLVPLAGIGESAMHRRRSA